MRCNACVRISANNRFWYCRITVFGHWQERHRGGDGRAWCSSDCQLERRTVSRRRAELASSRPGFRSGNVGAQTTGTPPPGYCRELFDDTSSHQLSTSELPTMSGPKNILYILPVAERGGAERIVETWACNHTKEFRPHVLVPAGGPLAESLQRL